MSQTDQDAVAGRVFRERKNLREQLAGIEAELSRIEKIFGELADQLKNNLGYLSRNFSRETFDSCVSKLPGLLENYRKAKEEENEKTEQIRKMGLE